MRHLQRFCALAIASLVLAATGCKASPQAPVTFIPQGTGSVLFIVNQKGTHSDGSKSYLAAYFAKGKIARFRIEIAPPQRDKSTQSSGISWGKGQFLAEPGSDSSALLSNLRKELEAKSPVPSVPHQASLSFTYALLGENQSVIKDGGFTSNPPGTWTTTKIFLGEDSEVYLNLSAAEGAGQFSIKDPEYGDDVVRELAKVL